MRRIVAARDTGIPSERWLELAERQEEHLAKMFSSEHIAALQILPIEMTGMLESGYMPEADWVNKYAPQPRTTSASESYRLKQLLEESIDYGELYVNDGRKKLLAVLGDADPKDLYDEVRAEAKKVFPGYKIEVEAEVGKPKDIGWRKVSALPDPSTPNQPVTMENGWSLSGPNVSPSDITGPAWSWPDPNAATPKPSQWQAPPKKPNLMDQGVNPQNWKPGTHNLMWQLGSPGKGFILQDGTVWTWKTDHMMPIHAKLEMRARMAGAAPVKRGTEFHIEPTGRVWQYGQGRSLDPGDLNVIQRTPTIWAGDALDPSAPVKADPQGHALRLMGAVEFPSPEELQAYQDANSGQDLQNLPGAVRVGGHYGRLQFHSNSEMQQVANAYNAAHGLGSHPNTYVRVNQDNAARIAQEYERMPHNPYDPQVAAAYEALKNEVRAQYDHAVSHGYSFEFYPEDGDDPYPNSPREAVMDLHHNKHMYVYPTASGFGSSEAESYPDHPLMGDTGIRWNGQPVYHNDLFRAIHDFYGHAKEGLGFRADGEDNAYRQHRAMFSPQARQALASETRGQNSWVNYGPYGLQNQTAGTADTVFAPQKAGIMPDWTMDPDIHVNAPVTSGIYYEGIVRDGGRYPPTHDYDEPWVEGLEA